MGGEHSRRHRGDHRHRDRMRLFRPRAYRADRAEARPRPPTRAAASSAASIRPSSRTGCSSRRRWRSSWPAASLRRWSAPATPPQPDKVVDYDPARCAGLAGVDVPEDRQQEILAAARLRRDPRRRLADRGAVMASRRRRRGRHRRGGRPDRGHRQGALDAAAARAGRRPADRDARAADRAPGAPRRGGARAQRGGDLELHRRGRGGAVRRLGLDPRQSDQRGDEGDAALAAARPARRGARATWRAAPRASRLFEIGRRYLADGERPTLGLVLAGDARPRGTGAAARRRRFDAFDAKAEALAILAAAGAPVDNLQVLGGASGVYHPGQSGRLGLGPKNVLAEFGALHPRIAQGLRPRRAGGRGRDLPRRDPAEARRPATCAAPMRRRALQAVKRDFAFLVPDELPADQLLRAVRGADKAAIAGARLFDVFTGQGVPEGRSRSRSRWCCSRRRRASPRRS